MSKQLRFQKIARLLALTKKAKLDPTDPETKSWLDYYRSIKDLSDCSMVDELNRITPEQALKLWDVVAEIRDMGGTLPEGLLDHLYNRGVSRKVLWCEEQVREKVERPLLGAGVVLDTIGLWESPISSAADILSGVISVSLGNNIAAILSFLAAIPGLGPTGGDILLKTIKYTLLAAKHFQKADTAFEIGGIIIDKTGMVEMAKTAIRGLEESGVESKVPEDLKDDYQEMTRQLERAASA